MQPLLDSEEVAEILGIAPGSLQNWRVRGIGPRHVKVGQFVRYRPEEVEQWLESRSKSSSKEQL
jgi:predicted DNA-binding transcriptional regulator AlpA